MATSPWYREGTAKFTQGSTTVTGTGTRWVDFVRAGDGIQGPDGKLYQVTNVASNTSISITPAYGSETAYWTIPIQGYVKQLADTAAQLVRDFGDAAEAVADFDNLHNTLITEANRAEDARDSAISAARSAGGYESNSLLHSQESERFANAASIAASASSGIWRPTLSSLRNVKDQPTNTMGVVYASATPSLNGWYVWNGSEWVKSALQPTQKSQFGEYNPIAIPVDNFDIISMNGVYRGIVPWDKNGTQTITVQHFQESGSGRRYQFAFIGWGNKTMSVRFRYFQSSSNSWGEWLQLADKNMIDDAVASIREYNPEAIPVDNFDNITENGIYKGTTPWEGGGTQTVTVNHFQEGDGGRRYQFAFFGLANKSALIYYRYFQSSSNSWGEWRKIIDDASLAKLLDETLDEELDYLDQRGSYLVYLPEYKGVKNKQERITSTVLKDFLLDIKILNATEGKIYKIESIGFDPTSDPRYTHNLTIRIMSTDKDVLDFVRMATYRVKVDTNKGIQTFTVKDVFSRAIEFTVDTGFLSSDSNTFYSFENPDGYRYTWYINPKNYIYHTDALSYNQIPSNNVSVNDTAQTYSNKFYTDPGENLLRGLNSPYRFHENGLVRSNIPARASFTFPKFDSSYGGMQVHETYPNVIRLNISSIDTATIAGNLTTQLFVSDWVSAYGIRRFRLLNPEPIHANVHGFLEFLIRVPDETTREVYTASIYTPGTAPAAMIEKQQHIGESSPLGRDEPRTLDVSSIVGDNIYIQDTTPEIIEEWLSGYWQKVYIPLSGVVSFYNNMNYTFSIYRRNVSGTPTTDDTIRNTDLIILNGSFSFYYDASPKINHRYHHHLDLVK